MISILIERGRRGDVNAPVWPKFFLKYFFNEKRLILPLTEKATIVWYKTWQSELNSCTLWVVVKLFIYVIKCRFYTASQRCLVKFPQNTFTTKTSLTYSIKTTNFCSFYWMSQYNDKNPLFPNFTSIFEFHSIARHGLGFKKDLQKMIFLYLE